MSVVWFNVYCWAQCLLFGSMSTAGPSVCCQVQCLLLAQCLSLVSMSVAWPSVCCWPNVCCSGHDAVEWAGKTEVKVNACQYVQQIKLFKTAGIKEGTYKTSLKTYLLRIFTSNSFSAT